MTDKAYFIAETMGRQVIAEFRQGAAEITRTGPEWIAEDRMTIPLEDKHHGKWIRTLSDDPVVITVGPSLRSDFVVGIAQWGDGSVTIQENGTDIFEPDDRYSIEKKYCTVSLAAVSEDTFLLTGRTTTI